MLHINNIAQESVDLFWDPLVLHSADLRSLDLYLNKSKAPHVKHMGENAVRLLDLEPEHYYQVWLVAHTSAGTFTSDKLLLKTHAKDNLTGLCVCLGEFEDEQELEQVTEILIRAGANVSETILPQTTHFLCTRDQGTNYDLACQEELQIIHPRWIQSRLKKKTRVSRLSFCSIPSVPTRRDSVSKSSRLLQGI